MDFAQRIPPQTLLGTALRLPFRLIPKDTVVPILKGPLRGRKWIAGSHVHGCWLGSYEFDKTAAYLPFALPGSIVYDLGANVGYYSLLSSVLVGPLGHVYSFEPEASNRTYLERHLKLNGLLNCTVYDFAVSADEGTIYFEGAGATGHISTSGIAVRTIKIDSLVTRNEIRPPDLIKCDIEGAEYDALSGARQTLERYHPTIFLATHGKPVHAQCCDLLQELGYALYALDGTSISEATELIALRSAPQS